MKTKQTEQNISVSESAATTAVTVTVTVTVTAALTYNNVLPVRIANCK
jgi:hypothetical protein